MFNEVSTIAHIVQLAVAPVFLLTGLGALLSVLTTRMSRIVDRGHIISKYIEEGIKESVHTEEINSLNKRLGLVHKAILSCSCSALIVCLVVATIFIGSYMKFHTGGIVAILFTLAMVFLIIAILFFIIEVSESIRSVRLAVKVF